LPAWRRSIAATPLQTLKDWAVLHTARDAAGVLPKAFTEERFDFNGRVLSGTPELEPRWKRGVNAVNGQSIGEAVGELYVAKHFPPETKAEGRRLVRNLIAAMDTRLANLPWMTPETKVKARAKLASFRPKIGYPDKWIDYSALTIEPGDAYGNVERATAFEYQRNLNKLGKPVDRDEWFMTPMTVNAYANPTDERDRLPGRDPAAAVLRSQRRRRDQLWRHRRRHRPRNQPPFRRPGPQVRPARALSPTGGLPPT
jgi:putative endopeptidase